MKFEQALHSMRLGNRVRRETWAQDERAPDHIVLQDGKLLAVSGEKAKAWAPKLEEILACDWQGV